MPDKEVILQFISNKKEDDRCDFKRKYYNDNAKYDLIKDVVSFANSRIMGDKYIIFNIDNDTYEISDMDMSTLPDISDIDTLLNEYVEPNILFDLNKFDYRGKKIAYLKINKNNSNFPYMIKKDYSFKDKVKIHKGQVYTRKGATNFIANRSDLDLLFSMKIDRTLRIDCNKIIQEQIVIDNNTKKMFKIPFVLRNNSKENFLIKEVSITLSSSNHFFVAKAEYVVDNNFGALKENQKLSLCSYDVKPHNTIEKSILFNISKECQIIFQKANTDIAVKVSATDVNGTQIWSENIVCGIDYE